MKEIEIPEGYEARIEDNKVIIDLKDSEDEKMRKFLLKYFIFYKNHPALYITPNKWQGVNTSDIINWLEKQKEQKSLNISAASEWLRKHVCRYMNSEYNEFHKCVEYDGSIDKEKLINDFEEAMRKEQKSAEKPKWYDSMDDLIADALIEMVEKSDLIDRDKKNRLVWIEKHRANSTEWSEEDEAIANLIIKELEQDKNDAPEYNRHFTRLLDWFTYRFKSLRPQPKQEWSEEDERNLTDTISTIEHLKNDCDWGYLGVGNDIDNVLNFLGSLPQRFSLQPK